jgi:hypothetical protein
MDIRMYIGCVSIIDKIVHTYIKIIYNNNELFSNTIDKLFNHVDVLYMDVSDILEFLQIYTDENLFCKDDDNHVFI